MKSFKIVVWFLVAMLALCVPLASSAETSPKHVVAASSGANTLLAADPSAVYVMTHLAVIATSTTAVSFYLYNGDNMLLGNATNKVTIDLDGIDGPMGFILPYNERGWAITDTKNELLGINLSAATPVIVIVGFRTIQQR